MTTNPKDDLPDHLRCTAKAKNTGERCTKPRVEGTTKCHYHGGRSKKGIASATWKHGGYSKYNTHLPPRISKLVEEIDTKGLTEHHEEIRLLTARLMDVLGRIGDNPARRWFDALDQFTRFKSANNDGDVKKAIEALSALENTLHDGAKEQGAWEESYRLLEQLRRHKESENKRVAEAGMVMRLDQATSLVQFMLQSVVSNVMSANIPIEEKNGIRQRIQDDFVQLRTRPDHPELISGEE